MANMQRGPKDAARVKLACLRMLAKLQLDPARRELISGFVDSYLELTMEEEEQLGEELQELHPQEKGGVMEIVTSWMKKGLEQERQEGLTHEQANSSFSARLRSIRASKTPLTPQQVSVSEASSCD